MFDVKLYILTHKKFDEEYGEIYEPILNGSALLDDDFGYNRDDTEDNISILNPYYAELTGQYWVWKNSKSDIIGFCHYRRYFMKNILLRDKIDKKEIIKILDSYDIIMPQKISFNVSNIEEIKQGESIQTGEEYIKLREIIKNESPEYLDSYDEVLNDKSCYWFNMYIARKELLDDYFDWMFTILEKFRKQHDFSKYGSEKRILGFLSERLINVYIKKNNLKVKENYIVQTQHKFPHLTIIGNKSHLVRKLVDYVVK